MLRLTTDQQLLIHIEAKQGTGGPIETILNLVTANYIWMVVMGNHDDLRMSNIFFDSNVPLVMNNCGCPVLLVS